MQNINILQVIGMIVAGVIAFSVLQSNVNAHGKTLDDHESRLRVIERDFLMALGEIKAEFQSVKSRLTAIEKAVKN